MKEVWVTDCTACETLGLMLWDRNGVSPADGNCSCECPQCGDNDAATLIVHVVRYWLLSPKTRRIIQASLGVPIDELC
jgi:hypothetical protein